jgi:hypothetical protein
MVSRMSGDRGKVGDSLRSELTQVVLNRSSWALLVLQDGGIDRRGGSYSAKLASFSRVGSSVFSC